MPQRKLDSSSKKRQRKSSPRGRKRRHSTDTKKKSSKKRALPKPKSTFPIQRIHELMEQKLPGGVVKPEAAIFFSSVMEYLAAELLELTINVSREGSNGANVKLKPSDVEAAIQSDAELRELMYRVRHS